MLDPSAASANGARDHQGPELPATLLTAAITMLREGVDGRTVRRIGVLRGLSRVSRQHAWQLRRHLTAHRAVVSELTPTPEPEERQELGRHRPRQPVDLLIDVTGSASTRARRLAASWNVPLLIPNSLPGRPPDPSSPVYRGQLQDVLGVHLPDARRDIAVERLAVRPTRPGSSCMLVVDDQPVTCAEGSSLTVVPAAAGRLATRVDDPGGESAEHTASRVRHQPLWGAFRLDLDGVPAGELRGLLKIRSLPKRLQLLLA